MENQFFKKLFSSILKSPNMFVVIYKEHCSKLNIQFGVIEQLLLESAKSCNF